MNIFILDNDPRTAAEYMCDKHIPKMIVETFQMMGSALRRHGARDEQMPLTQAGKPLIGGYKHHPCTVWAGDSICNFVWLGLHGMSLCDEYTFRYNKTHSCDMKIRHMCELMDMLPNIPQTPYALAMPDEYKCSDAIDSYRRYYIMEKSRFAKWEKGRESPHWWNKEECYV
jgi:hypothetical protein